MRLFLCEETAMLFLLSNNSLAIVAGKDISGEVILLEVRIHGKFKRDYKRQL